jgi:hypothetical protein
VIYPPCCLRRGGGEAARRRSDRRGYLRLRLTLFRYWYDGRGNSRSVPAAPMEARKSVMIKCINTIDSFTCNIPNLETNCWPEHKHGYLCSALSSLPSGSCFRTRPSLLSSHWTTRQQDQGHLHLHLLPSAHRDAHRFLQIHYHDQQFLTRIHHPRLHPATSCPPFQRCRPSRFFTLLPHQAPPPIPALPAAPQTTNLLSACEPDYYEISPHTTQSDQHHKEKGFKLSHERTALLPPYPASTAAPNASIRRQS